MISLLWAVQPNHSPHWVLVILLSVSTAGCAQQDTRQPVFPVRGQVFVDQQPAKDAFVIFHPLDDASPHPTKASARVGADGSFQMSTYNTADSVPAGDYAVTVWWRKVTPDGDELGPDRLNGKYSDALKSKLRVQVQAGSNELGPFQLLR